MVDCMKVNRSDDARGSRLLESIVEELERGRELLFRIDDETYVASKNGTGSVGGHFRHNLNFVDAVLLGVETSVIDYNKRIRDPLIEANRLYAASKSEDAAEKVRHVAEAKMSLDVTIVSEFDSSLTHRSTISREFEFVHSHTVHHHALIAEKLAGMGIKVSDNFGVAPATLEYWKQKAA